MSRSRCSEPAKITEQDPIQNIAYFIDSLDTYIGEEMHFCFDSYGLSIFQHPELEIGCYTIKNIIYLFNINTCTVERHVEVPKIPLNAKYKKSQSEEILYCCEFAIVNEQVHIITGGSTGCIYCINLQVSEPIRILSSHGGPIHCIKSNPKYPFVIASCGKDRSIKVWDLRSPVDNCDYITFAGLKGHTMQINSISWHSSGVKLASGGYDLKICIWDIPISIVSLWEKKTVSFTNITPTLIQHPLWATMMLHNSAVDCVIWLDTLFLSKAADGEILCWVPAEDNSSFYLDVERLQQVNIILRLSFETDIRWFVQFGYCHNNNHVVCGNTDGEFMFWNLKDCLKDRNDIISKPVKIEDHSIRYLKNVINEERKLISYAPGVSYNYNYKHLNCCLRNFGFSLDGNYCFALTEKGNIVRFSTLPRSEE